MYPPGKLTIADRRPPEATGGNGTLAPAARALESVAARSGTSYPISSWRYARRGIDVGDEVSCALDAKRKWYRSRKADNGHRACRRQRELGLRLARCRRDLGHALLCGRPAECCGQACNKTIEIVG